MKRAVGFLIIAAALAVFGYFWWQSISTPPAEAEDIVPPVSVQQPQQRTLRQELSLSGSVEADSQVTVLPKVSGELATMRVEEGEEVEQGQVVATINDEQYAPRAAEADATLAAARSSFERAERLFETGSTTEEQFEQARARFQSAQAQARLAELEVEYTEIESPIAGTIVGTEASVGDMVGQQTPIVTVATTQALIVTVDVPERYYRRVSQGAIAGVELLVPAAADNRLPVRIETVAPHVSARTKTFELTVQLTGDRELVRPGMYADLFVVLSEMRTQALPIEALVGSSRLWYVDDAGTAREITLDNPQTTDDFVAVPAEHAGRRFIVGGQHFLSEGQQVNVTGGADSE